MKSDLRGLGEHHSLIEQLSNGGELYSITEKLKNEKEYWMGIRNNKVMIYYMGGKILDISSSGLLGFDPKYIAHYDNKIKIGKRFANAEDWLSKEKLLKSAIHSYQTNYNKNEKIAQQEIILENNNSQNSEWYFVDMEYSVPGISYGRFDMIAISKRQDELGKYQIMLVELKTGTNAFGGAGEDTYGSGIAGHINNFYKFLYGESGKQNILRLAKEITTIMANYNALGLNNAGLNFALEDIDVAPENVKCVILCTDIKEKEKAQTQASKYIFNFKGASKWSLEKKWGNSFEERIKKLNVDLSIVDKERVIDTTKFEKIETLR